MDQVEQVKQKSDIVQIIGERIDTKKAGRNYKALCPFHGEKSPSFMISPERQTFKCFGCGEGGDVITFLQKYENMSFLEALEYLASRAGIELKDFQPSSQDARKKKLLEVMDLAGEYYSWILNKHNAGEKARKYLADRGVGSEAVKQFQLGYSPDTWRSVSEFLINKKGYSSEDLIDVGLTIKSNSGFYDRFRGRLMFPLKDHKGKVVGFSGRVIEGGEKEAKYINSPETRLYSKGEMLYGLWENRSYVRKEKSLIMVEGELDMIPSWQAGVRNVVAIKGSAFTDEQAKLIARYTKNIVMALDSDSAGEEAVKRAVKVAEVLDMNINVVQIIGGKDPGDIATKSAKEWKEMVGNAVSYYQFLIDSAVERNDIGTGEGVRKVSEEVVPTLADVANLVVRGHYVKLLAKKLSIPEDLIYEEIERESKKKELNTLKGKVKEIEKSSESRGERVQEYLLSLSLQFYKRLEEKIKDIKPEWMTNPGIAKIFRKLGEMRGELDIKKFGSLFPEELQDVLDKAYLRDLTDISRGGMLEKEFDKTRDDVEEYYIREKMRELGEKIKKAESSGDEEGLKMLQREFSEFSRKLSVLG